MDLMPSAEDFIWDDEDDGEWTQLAVQAVDDAEITMIYSPSVTATERNKVGSSSALRIAPGATISTIHNAIKEKEEELLEDPCEKMWDEIGNFAYKAFNDALNNMNSNKERLASLPSLPPPSTGKDEQQKASNSNTKTSRLRHWLNIHVIIASHDFTSGNNKDNTCKAG